MSVVLDTSFLIDLASGAKDATRLLSRLQEEGESLLIPSIAVTEFLIGLPRPQEVLERIRRSADVLPFTASDALKAAELGNVAFEEGRFPGWMDLLISGFAVNRGGLPVVTRNARHFADVPTISY